MDPSLGMQQAAKGWKVGYGPKSYDKKLGKMCVYSKGKDPSDSPKNKIGRSTSLNDSIINLGGLISI